METTTGSATDSSGAVDARLQGESLRALRTGLSTGARG